MGHATLGNVAKKSLFYSYVLSQPFTVYVDAYPVLQNKLLLESEQLQYSENGEAVRVLQYKLNKLSYYDDDMDGEFGVLTEHALKNFQENHNLEVTGQTDLITIQALIDLEKQQYIDKVKRMSESIYLGMHSEDVKIVQEALFYFGYYEGNIDGIYGPLTKRALEIAEENHDIKLINEVDSESLMVLYEEESLTEEVITEEPQENKNDENSDQKADKDPPPKEVDVVSSSNTDVIQVAQSLIGTPYVWGGQSPSGFDCSGFIHYVFQEEGITLPRTVAEIWNYTSPVTERSIGDFVFFETYKAGPSHMGIYIGDNQFIHAGSSRGVEISELSNSYWQEKYMGTKRIK